jgi:Cu+-exporting ATPase
MMFRRQFLQLLTAAGISSLASLEAMASTTTQTWFVQGFSCITCATGLDTMLSRQKGVISSQSTYPEGKVTVAFDPGQITPQAIVAFIADLGFTVRPGHKS